MDLEKGSNGLAVKADGPTNASPAYKTAAGMIIDFHSGEFNRTDDLNDHSGNYRTFEPLAGIVTADMRHQLERLSAIKSGDMADGRAVLPKRGERNRIEAAPPRDRGPLTVTSHGRTLIVDTDPSRGMACAGLLVERGLECTVWVVKNESPPPSPSRFEPFRRIEADAVSITGAFGGYFASMAAEEGRRPLQAGSGDEVSVFDLVLDLHSPPAYAGDRLPLGYYAPGADPAALSAALAELPEMKGRFLRPQFTLFFESRCLHARSRTTGCGRCLAVCPFGAIQSTRGTISVDHHRCQGCGGCALVCPTDAVRMIHPSPSELLDRLRETLIPKLAGPSGSPMVVISEPGAPSGRNLPTMDDENPHGRVDFTVEQIGHVGVEILLTALECGADEVTVSCGAGSPHGIREALEQQVRLGRALLRATGNREERIRFAVLPPAPLKSEPARSEMPLAEEPEEESVPPSGPSAVEQERRTLTRLAAQRLFDRSGIQEPDLPLPTGSPYGAVKVDSALCTLCMACAVACPTGALLAKGDRPRLELIESRCHQCGLCEEVCPEGALQRIPRLLCDPETIETPAVLNEAEPLRCVACGTPFASRAMVDRIQSKLKGHRMYAADRQVRRLRMCRTCRTQDALGDREMNPWNEF